MSKPKPLTEQTPREIDEQLAKLYQREFDTKVRQSEAAKRYVKCPQCGVAVCRSSRGKVRKHNPPVKK